MNKDTENAELRKALAGMLESYELLMSDQLPLNDIAKGVVYGAFIGEPEKARKLLGKTK
jgi:hypothetical protein